MWQKLSGGNWSQWTLKQKCYFRDANSLLNQFKSHSLIWLSFLFHFLIRRFTVAVFFLDKFEYN